jgi:hypothetical protein
VLHRCFLYLPLYIVLDDKIYNQTVLKIIILQNKPHHFCFAIPIQAIPGFYIPINGCPIFLFYQSTGIPIRWFKLLVLVKCLCPREDYWH